ncbi:hypothetical protein OEZ85_002282 [Tetradesmus obliquus]|uniref:Coenzyme Q-binding protein COQ10 START domain-containing protein n=1 Tax=Tetradesmus obliquus TaxID=3088 RepID=A0ABY8U2H6_TETOB|nr:hypothetical protein OEZ85_002282 [Tetradesmus obliquus]
MSGKEEVLPLPDMPQSQQGTSTATGKGYTASVSNAAGYLCHIQLDATFDVPPEVIFEIFCHPDNAGAFRDIKCVGYRKVKQQEPGFKLVEVEQCGELRVLWIHRVFKTYLDVTEDTRDPECLKTEFTLLRSDLLSRFFGSWELRPIKDGSGKVTGCRAVLHQDVLPKGVPTFFAHLPVLGGLLRRVSLGTIQRLIEDILYIVKKYTDGAGKLSVDDCIAKIAEERGHKTVTEENRAGSSGGEAGSSDNNNNAAVASFAIESFSESGSESEEEEKEGEAAEAAGDTQQEKPAAAAAAAAAAHAA